MISLGVRLVNRGVIWFKLMVRRIPLMHFEWRESSWEDSGQTESSGAPTRTGALVHMYVRLRVAVLRARWLPRLQIEEADALTNCTSRRRSGSTVT